MPGTARRLPVEQLLECLVAEVAEPPLRTFHVGDVARVRHIEELALRLGPGERLERHPEPEAECVVRGFARCSVEPGLPEDLW